MEEVEEANSAYTHKLTPVRFSSTKMTKKLPKRKDNGFVNEN